MTAKQLEIVRLVAEGLKDREIGQRIGNTEYTVKKYLGAIFDQTGTFSRLELALWWVKGGCNELPSRGKELYA